jgi:hypothetical protein
MKANGANFLQISGYRLSLWAPLVLLLMALLGILAPVRLAHASSTESSEAFSIKAKKTTVGSATVASESNFSSTSMGNSRIVRLQTNGDAPVLLPLVKGFPSVVEFPKGEKVLDIAVGGMSDWSQAWEVVKRD